MSTLFSAKLANKQPLANSARPTEFTHYVGQEHLLNKEALLYNIIQQNQLSSIILWGPPGCGKTTLAKLIAQQKNAALYTLNAVLASISDIKSIVKEAASKHDMGQQSILFIDEIHRFNKIQQDALLPHIENGRITLFAATTENPYFALNSALISRCHVFELEALSSQALGRLLNNLINKNTQLKALSEECKQILIAQAFGDARQLINAVECILDFNETRLEKLGPEQLKKLIQKKGIAEGKHERYDLISALIKSMRASDHDGAIYWLARLVKSGEDTRYISRRLVIFASEDIGYADPKALPLAASLIPASQQIGMPEIQINLAHVVGYLAQAKKSRTSYNAIKQAIQDIDNGKLYTVPPHLKQHQGFKNS